jgi:hypothetical protein
VSAGDLAVVLLVAALGLGYGAREVAMFRAAARHPAPLLPYPPERLRRRLRLSAGLEGVALLLAGFLWSASDPSRAGLTAGLSLAVLVAAALLARAAWRDLRATREACDQARRRALGDD